MPIRENTLALEVKLSPIEGVLFPDLSHRLCRLHRGRSLSLSLLLYKLDLVVRRGWFESSPTLALRVNLGSSVLEREGEYSEMPGIIGGWIKLLLTYL